VVVGPLDELFRTTCLIEDVNFVSIAGLDAPRRVLARIRYRAEPVGAEIWPTDGGRVEIRFDQPQRAVAPGQAAVFYDPEQPDLVVGGGTII
jgi:tRNA-specific 2-thiouridylase